MNGTPLHWWECLPCRWVSPIYHCYISAAPLASCALGVSSVGVLLLLSIYIKRCVTLKHIFPSKEKKSG